MLLKILLICVVIGCFGGMVYGLYQVKTADCRPDITEKGVMGFTLYGMAFLISGIFTAFYLFLQ